MDNAKPLCVLAPLRDYFFLSYQRKKAFRRLRASTLFFFSQRREGAKGSLTTFAALLCETIFFLSSQRKKAFRRLRANILFFFSQRREGAKRNRTNFAACPPRRIGRRKEKRVGTNLKCHLSKEKMLLKGSPQLWLQLYF